MAVNNGERYLADALHSVSAQTFTDWECLTVDDGSTDKSGEILRQWAAADSRFCIITMPANRGLAESLNTALARARGDYVARMDADDLCLRDRFLRQVDFLDAHPEITVLGTAALYIDEFGTLLRHVQMPQDHECIVAQLPRRTSLIHPSVMMRREALRRAGGYDRHQRYAQDLELWARGASLGWHFHNLRDPLLRYRSQPASHPSHSWTVFWLRMRNGFTYGYPWRALFWALVALVATSPWAVRRALRAWPVVFTRWCRSRTGA